MVYGTTIGMVYGTTIGQTRSTKNLIDMFDKYS